MNAAFSANIALNITLYCSGAPDLTRENSIKQTHDLPDDLQKKQIRHTWFRRAENARHFRLPNKATAYKKESCRFCMWRH